MLCGSGKIEILSSCTKLVCCLARSVNARSLRQQILSADILLAGYDTLYFENSLNHFKYFRTLYSQYKLQEWQTSVQIVTFRAHFRYDIKAENQH